MMRYIMVVLLALWSSVSAATLTVRVTESAADAKVYGDHLETGENEALVGNSGSYRCDCLVRFNDVILPSAVIVDSAFLSLQASISLSGSVCSGTIRAEDTADASLFSTFADYDARHPTGAVVQWDSIQSMSAATWYRTPDIAEVVREVVERADWSSGNALAVFIADDSSSAAAYRRFYHYDNDSTDACSLIVYYHESSDERQALPRRRAILLSAHVFDNDCAFRNPAEGLMPIDRSPAGDDPGNHTGEGERLCAHISD